MKKENFIMKKQLVALGAFLVMGIAAMPSMAACPCKSHCCPAVVPCCPAAPIACPCSAPDAHLEDCCPRAVQPCCPAKPCCQEAMPCPCPCPAAPVEPCCDKPTCNDCCD